jgi:hypothetical protein
MEGSRALSWALLLVRLNFSGFTIKFETESPTVWTAALVVTLKLRQIGLV